MRSMVCIAAVVVLSLLPVAEAELIEEARARQDDLRLSAYLTARTVEEILEPERDPMTLLHEHGFTRVILEVYRSGRIVSPEHLARVRDFFEAHGVEVMGGIATTPGGDVGVHQEGPLTWFNWQNPKTQRDLEAIMRSVAPVFDTFVVDDFLCTGDVSAESQEAKGERTWAEYRCDLLSNVAREVFVEPAKAENPAITMIIKFPQWYDRFHLFGYDVARKSAKFDQVWVGTETRGARTQRFGFVQPYEGFINYRWIASVAPEKTVCAWFDHGDCDALDFVDQAYQSVLAGARDLTIFNYADVAGGHPGDALLVENFTHLADLAAAIRQDPVWGVPGYKPVNSDPGGDMYLMDYVGMLGVPLLPVAAFPEDAAVVFLPTQAAADPAISAKLDALVSRGGRAIVTAGFVANVPDTAALAGLRGPVILDPVNVPAVSVDGQTHSVEYGLDLAARLEIAGAEVLLETPDEQGAIPFLTRHRAGEGEIYVVNCHTFSQEDFDTVGEVLLAPRPLGLLELPQAAVDRLREAFIEPIGLAMEAPAWVTFQPFGNRSAFIQNYNLEPATIVLEPYLREAFSACRNRLTDEEIALSGGRVVLEIPARGRCWLEGR